MNFKIADRKFKELLLPTLLIVMALNISSVIDSFFVGAFIGKEAVAAIELLEPLILFITVFEWLFGLGGQILALNKKAEFDSDGSNRYFTASIVASIIASGIIALICLFFMEPLTVVLGATPGTKHLIMEYTTFLTGCFVVSTVAGVLTQYIRVDGMPNFSSIVIIVSNVINIVLDYIFLAWFKWGMMSASLATFIGYSVCLLLCIIYFRSPKRTFMLVRSALAIKTFLTHTWEMIKVGFPGASIGFFDVILVYLINRFLGAVLGDPGLTTYMVCMDALVIASIVDIGIAETLTSIIPIYYTKHDYLNLKHLIRISLIFITICAVALVAFFWIWPEGFLLLYKFDNVDIKDMIVNALRLYSLFFIVSILPNLLIFYYEAIERSLFSTILSVLFTLVMPLASVYLLYNLIGINGIWLGFSLGALITLIIIFISVKLIQKREPQYSGLFFFEEDLIPRTRNFVFADNDLAEKEECLNHLKDLNADETFCNNANRLFETIFESNESDTPVEVLITDYDDTINLDIKYDGEKENLEYIKKEFVEDNVKYAELLGFNNIEYVMNKS